MGIPDEGSARQGLHADHDEAQGEAQSQHRADDEDERAQDPGVVAMLVVDRQEPAHAPVEAERDEGLEERDQ